MFQLDLLAYLPYRHLPLYKPPFLLLTAIDEHTSLFCHELLNMHAGHLLSETPTRGSKPPYSASDRGP